VQNKPEGFFKKLFNKIKNLFNKNDGIPVDSEETMVFDKTKTLREIDKKKAPKFSEETLKGKGRGVSSLFKPREGNSPFAVSAILTTIRIAAVAFLVLAAAGVGAVIGVANAYLETTPELDTNRITDNDLTSFIYDKDGMLITSYSGMENRDYATLDEIPDTLEHAVIAVEDVRFYYHNGIDLKRLFGAAVSNFTGGSISGGSTITQQLIKNKILSPERSYKRKIQEASLAIQLEKQYSKDEILEAYLNSIPLGGTNYGVKVAAMDYFGKELDELSLRECACLAGITQNPYAYNPRRAYFVTGNTEALNARIDTVLKRMYTAGYIDLDEYNAALNDEITVIEKSSVSGLYEMPHFVEYAIADVISALIEDRGLEDTAANRSAIENELRTSGYRIYTTVDTNVQKTIESTFENYDRFPSMQSSQDNVTVESIGGATYETIQPQAATVVIDHTTGEIRAMVGARTVPTMRKTFNRASESRMPIGSTIKPIAVYGPALDMGAGLGTIIPNIKVPIDGWTTNEGYPTSSHGSEINGTKYGPRTIRQGIVSSLNIVAARTLVYNVGVDVSYQYLVNLGISEEALNKDGVGLALGTSGITMLELSAAYACIANGGTYIEPCAFTRVEDSEGNVILAKEDVQETRQVFKPSTSFMLVDALKNAVESGTGRRAKISGMTVAGKTGTNTGSRSICFAGFTPYYTSSVWIGSDKYKKMSGVTGGDAAAPLWQAYMSEIHEGLENRSILPGSAGDYGVVQATVCGVSGMSPLESCASDTMHPLVTDYFAKDSLPDSELTCNMHAEFGVCTLSGMLATEYCPIETLSEGAAVIISDESPYALIEDEELIKIFPNYLRVAEPCTTHTEEWFNENQALMAAIDAANSLLNEVHSFISSNPAMPSELRNPIDSAMSELNKQLAATPQVTDAIISATDTLRAQYSYAKNNIPAPEVPQE